MASIEQPGEAPGVNVSGSQGIQIGTGNNQYNAWMPKALLDPAVLGKLTPQAAVVRLQQASHDELVDFFADVSADDVSEILDVFLEVDGTKIVAALGDIDYRQAGALIRIGHILVKRDLAGLPDAAEAIDREAARLGWANTEPLEAIWHWYVRRYKYGRIFWTKEFGVAVTSGVVDECLTSGFGWGCPEGDQEEALTSPSGTKGIRQAFLNSMVYASNHGVFSVADDMCHENEGGSGGWLGFPVSESQSNGQFGTRQMFEGGTVYSYGTGDEPKSFAVRREVMSVLPDQGWRPVSKVTHTVSSSGTPSAVQHFEVGLKSGNWTTAVYSSKHYGPVMVAPEVWDYYSKLGAEKSWLGLPRNDILVFPSEGYGGQVFEEGTIYWQPRIAPIAVRDEVRSSILRFLALVQLTGKAPVAPVPPPREPLGFPVTEERPIGTGESDRIQFFQHGVVTRRDGRYEVWIGPGSSPGWPAEERIYRNYGVPSTDEPRLYTGDE